MIFLILFQSGVSIFKQRKVEPFYFSMRQPSAVNLLLLLSMSTGLSIDCPNMINFARGLGVQTAQPGIWAALQSDCCIANGVNCTSQRVTQIYWDSKGLNGVINGSAIPSSLLILRLSYNQINGSLPSVWPYGLEELCLEYNQISGSVPSMLPRGVTILSLSHNQLKLLSNTTVFPIDLQFLYLAFNDIAGSVPPIWPIGLVELDLSHNQMSGSISGTALPSGLKHIYLNNNEFTGSIPLILPSGLIKLWVCINKFTGDVPTFPDSLQYLYLGYPGLPGTHFTGSVKLNRPKELFLNDNWISDLSIQNSTALLPGNCDISNNALLGNPNIASLTMCVKNGLYNPSLLPITVTTTTAMETIRKESTAIATETIISTIASDISQIQFLASSEIVFTTLSTVQFGQKSFEVILNFWMVVRVVIDALIFTVVARKTPFKREFKKKIKLRNKKNKVSVFGE